MARTVGQHPRWERLGQAVSLVFIGIAMLLSGSVARADSPSSELLPPERPWNGVSRELMASPEDPWITPAERSGLIETPRYDESIAWLKKLVATSPQLSLHSLGKSHEGRDVWMVVAASDGSSTPEALAASGKPILLAHGGIHSGEIDGKDAGLMLLRDLTVGGSRRHLLEGAHFLFVPILNVDGHERFSAYGRINQRGPREMGWRTNARNQNLNRDFSKLDTPEVRALVAAINRWKPDLYLDLHVTDGADYQYDITFGYSGRHAHSPQGAAWLDERLSPALERDLATAGHIPGPLIFLIDSKDPSKGNFGWTAGPRFSNSYGDLRHLPTVLVENHSLKPYDQRVLGTYILLESSLATLAKHGAELRRASQRDRETRRDPMPLTFKMADYAALGETPPTLLFRGYESKLTLSPISGGLRQEWTSQPMEMEIPWIDTTEPDLTVRRPAAYWLSPVWSEVIERLKDHGIAMEQISQGREVEVELYRLNDAEIEPRAFEGHARVKANPEPFRSRQTYPAGSVRIPTDQALGDLAVLLLEPASPDSFFQWGFFLEVLQRTEYFEAYVAEPLAERMIAEDPELAQRFRDKLANDAEFAGSANARLRWFYEQTPFADARWKVYPVGREVAPAGEGR
ncbi:MAG: M14 family metallopeptidase [Deltaproteobacteria bacterium]|nr:M14 family metallopeptidase [Deltaproteobacteria bacterium]